MKVVIDTTVLVRHLWSKDKHSSDAIYVVKNGDYEVLVCPKLRKEYVGVLSRGPDGTKETPMSPQLYGVISTLVDQMLPRMKAKPDPTVRIKFGPSEDQFHLQLAIDHGAGYHVSTDDDVVAAAGDLMVAGNVKGCYPRDFVRDCGRD